MTSQSQGIQHLLQAEKRAKDKLEEAKKRKGKRLRQAKEEAIAEIDQYKLQRENDFRRIQSTILGSQGNLAVKVDEQTGAKIQSLKVSYGQCREKVMQDLLGLIYDINPELHANYRDSF
ncbi:V-type proton ATPase subunit G 3-like [Ambystoma mexicanum]|uniref:V-type proton ATPase subunit G 3-like n=1 Tax=Ambystoma mexicanum TaxID=8296 RepID=UPI0037E80372